MFRGHDIHLRHRVVVPRICDLVLLKLPAGGHFVGDIADPDRGDHISAEKVKSCQKHASDIADRQHMDTLFAVFRLVCQDFLKFRMGCGDRAECPGLDLVHDFLRELPDLSVSCGRIQSVCI